MMETYYKSIFIIYMYILYNNYKHVLIDMYLELFMLHLLCISIINYNDDIVIIICTLLFIFTYNLHNLSSRKYIKAAKKIYKNS